MGLITGLLTLPLAPVRGTAWLAEQIREQAEAEFYDEGAIREQLMELQALHEAGEIDDETLALAEDELLERLVAARGLTGEETGGRVEEQ
jgi:Gas vesicle protein G